MSITESKWELSEEIDMYIVDCKGDNCIISISKVWKGAEEIAHLIAAAPQLYEEIKEALKNMESDSVQCNGDWQVGMFCGLEDRNIIDRYDACIYGYEKALERVREWVLFGFEAAVSVAEGKKE